MFTSSQKDVNNANKNHILDYIKHNNANPKPFVWTKSAEAIIQKVKRGKALLDTLH